MKKLLSLILVALMVLPFGAFASVGAFADGEEVIYVKAGGKGDGSSADSPLGSLESANKLAAKKDADVIIKFVGNFTFDATGYTDKSKYDEPAHKNKITWAGNDADATLTIKTTDAARYYSMGGELAIKDLNIEIDGAKVLVILTNLYDFTAEEGVTIQNPQSEIDTITVCGALKSYFNNEFYDASTKTHTANPTITVKSGRFKQLVPYFLNSSNMVPGVKLDGKVTVNISGEDTYVYQAYASANSYNTVTDCEIVLDGGIIGRFVGNSDRKYNSGMMKHGAAGALGTYTLYITKNFDFDKQDALVGAASDGEFYQGLCGTTANKDYLNSAGDELLGTFILKLDDEIADQALQESIKINLDTFDQKVKPDGTEIVGGGVFKPNNQPTVKDEEEDKDTTPADTQGAVDSTPVDDETGPATDANTNNDTTTDTADDEGGVSIGLIIGICAAVVVVGGVVAVLVLKKKKA